MNRHTAISRAGNSIVNLLREKIKSIIGDINDTDIILGHPDESNDAIITVFLYRIDENPYLKNQELYNHDPTKKSSVPMALDLYYLIIANSNSQNNKASEEHDIIGAAMQVLYENPVFTNYIADDRLLECGQDFRVIFQSLSLGELSELRNASHKLANRTFVCYLVTPVIISSNDSETSVPRVASANLEFMACGREKK